MAEIAELVYLKTMTNGALTGALRCFSLKDPSCHGELVSAYTVVQNNG